MNGYKLNIAKKELATLRAADRAVVSRCRHGVPPSTITRELRYLKSCEKLFTLLNNEAIETTINDYYKFWNFEPSTVEPPLFADLFDTCLFFDEWQNDTAATKFFFIDEQGRSRECRYDVVETAQAAPLANYISNGDPETLEEACVEVLYGFLKKGGKIKNECKPHKETRRDTPYNKRKSEDELPGTSLIDVAGMVSEYTHLLGEACTDDYLCRDIMAQIMGTYGVVSLQTYRKFQAAKIRSAEVDEAREHLERCLELARR